MSCVDIFFHPTKTMGYMWPFMWSLPYFPARGRATSERSACEIPRNALARWFGFGSGWHHDGCAWRGVRHACRLSRTRATWLSGWDNPVLRGHSDETWRHAGGLCGWAGSGRKLDGCCGWTMGAGGPGLCPGGAAGKCSRGFPGGTGAMFRSLRIKGLAVPSVLSGSRGAKLDRRFLAGKFGNRRNCRDCKGHKIGMVGGLAFG